MLQNQQIILANFSVGKCFVANFKVSHNHLGMCVEYLKNVGARNQPCWSKTRLKLL